MINCEGIKAIIFFTGAIVFTNEFGTFTHFLNALRKSKNTLAINERLIHDSTFFAIWLLCLYALTNIWFLFITTIIRIFNDY